MKNHPFIYSLCIVVILAILFYSCGDKDSDVTGPSYINQSGQSGFNSPEEYIQNPSVQNAVQNSGININYGNNPPPLVGDYNAVGECTKASIQLLVGLPLNSLITLYNQTNSGKIDFREKVGNITAWASGGYITGDNGSFTIWQESRQSGEEAGLPDDLAITVALLMSGTKLNNGDLIAKGISIVTKAESNNTSYNLDNVIGLWWMWEADFILIGPPSGKPVSIEDLTDKYNKPMSFVLRKIFNIGK